MPGHVELVVGLVSACLDTGHLLLGKGRQRDGFDAVGKLAVDAAAGRAHERVEVRDDVLRQLPRHQRKTNSQPRVCSAGTQTTTKTTTTTTTVNRRKHGGRSRDEVRTIVHTYRSLGFSGVNYLSFFAYIAYWVTTFSAAGAGAGAAASDALSPQQPARQKKVVVSQSLVNNNDHAM